MYISTKHLRDMSLIEEELVIEMCVCGYHIYNNVAVVMEELSCAYEARQEHEGHSVAMLFIYCTSASEFLRVVMMANSRCS